MLGNTPALMSLIRETMFTDELRNVLVFFFKCTATGTTVLLKDAKIFRLIKVGGLKSNRHATVRYQNADSFRCGSPSVGRAECSWPISSDGSC